MLRELFRLVLVLVALASIVLAIVRFAFVDEYQITGIGMLPTLAPGENAFGWRGATIEIGDIAVCEHPTRTGNLVIGRVIATGGQEVKVDQGQLYVRDRKLDTRVVGEFTFTNPLTNRPEQVEVYKELLSIDKEHLIMKPARAVFRLRALTVPEGQVYLLGDNRGENGAEDSRAFGPVVLSSCRAQIVMRNGAVSGVPGPEHGRFDLLR